MRRVIAIALAAWVGCGDGGEVVEDAAPAADAGAIADAPGLRDGSAPLAWVDFTISGCEAPEEGDAGIAGPCTGQVPLALRFTPLAPAPIDLYLWSFGDGVESQEGSPLHRYALPGTYTVSLTVGGPGGTASTTRPGIVVARPAGLGAACTQALQCADERACACAAEDDCEPPLPHGLCTEGCGVEGCAEGVCAELDPAQVASPAEWQRRLCLPDCTGNGDCPAGLTCQMLRDGDGDGWISACFSPAVLGPIGAECVDAFGVADGGRCASGTCLAEGARGLCTAACEPGTCPEGSACATFGDPGLGSLCLARCEADTDCATDPWLACEAPGADAPRGFTVDEPPAAGGYCAPRRCEEAADCGPDGACIDDYCTAL